jgi:fucose 4-O-acetylase-like acetyltransferase
MKYKNRMKKPEYIVEMQVARGIGILLVTVGHSEPVKTVFPTLFSVIYAFHMPLFFFLSGFFSGRIAGVRSLKDWVRVVPSRLVYLIIPYLAITASYSFLKYFVPELALRPVVPEKLLIDVFIYPTENPALFLWFLYTLIIIQALAPILARVNTYAMCAALLILQGLQLDIPFLGLGLIFHYLIYYYVGLTAHSVQEEFLRLLRKSILPPAACLVFVAAYLIWAKTGIDQLLTVTALSGIMCVLSLCFCWLRYFPVGTLEAVGKYSFPIYLLQYFFIFPLYFLLRGFSVRGEWIVPCTFVVGLLGPLILVVYVFPHARLLSLLFSGMGRSSKARA